MVRLIYLFIMFIMSPLSAEIASMPTELMLFLAPQSPINFSDYHHENIFDASRVGHSYHHLRNDLLLEIYAYDKSYQSLIIKSLEYRDSVITNRHIIGHLIHGLGAGITLKDTVGKLHKIDRSMLESIRLFKEMIDYDEQVVQIDYVPHVVTNIHPILINLMRGHYDDADDLDDQSLPTIIQQLYVLAYQSDFCTQVLYSSCLGSAIIDQLGNLSERWNLNLFLMMRSCLWIDADVHDPSWILYDEHNIEHYKRRFYANVHPEVTIDEWLMACELYPNIVKYVSLLDINDPCISDQKIARLVNSLDSTACEKMISQNAIGLTNKGMQQLLALPYLQMISLQNNDAVTSLGFAGMHKDMGLLSLSLERFSQIDTDACGNIVQAKWLEHIRLSYCNKITNTSLSWFNQLYRLVKLDLEGLHITNDAIMLLFKEDWRLLIVLTIEHCCNLTLDMFSYITRRPLSVSSVSIKDCPNITEHPEIQKFRKKCWFLITLGNEPVHFK